MEPELLSTPYPNQQELVRRVDTKQSTNWKVMMWLVEVTRIDVP